MLTTSKYVLLDAARMGEAIETAKELNPSFDSLYRGNDLDYLASVSPYIFSLKNDTEFGKWYFENGWGYAWGVVLFAAASLAECHIHLKKIILVQTEEKAKLFFRFYDPRVLRIFLPTCNTQQLSELFGPVEKFICEDEDPLFALVFSFNGRALVTERVTADTFFSPAKENTGTEVLPANNKDNNTTRQAKPGRKFFID